MPSQKITNRVEQAILNHDQLKAAARKVIKEAPDKPTAVADIRKGFETWLMGRVATVVLAEDGVTAKHTTSDSFTQGMVRDALDECDFSGLVDKYWDSVRGS